MNAYSNKVNTYTNKEIENLIDISVNLTKIILNSKQIDKESNTSKRSIEKILSSSEPFLYLPKISNMVEEVKNYYNQKYNSSQLSFKF